MSVNGDGGGGGADREQFDLIFKIVKISAATDATSQGLQVA